MPNLHGGTTAQVACSQVLPVPGLSGHEDALADGNAPAHVLDVVDGALGAICERCEATLLRRLFLPTIVTKRRSSASVLGMLLLRLFMMTHGLRSSARIIMENGHPWGMEHRRR